MLIDFEILLRLINFFKENIDFDSSMSMDGSFCQKARSEHGTVTVFEKLVAQ